MKSGSRSLYKVLIASKPAHHNKITMSFSRSEILTKIRELNFPLGRYVLVGGASLAIRGIRETKDLDVIVLPSLFAELLTQGWSLDDGYEERWNKKRVKRGDVEIYQDLFLEKKNTSVDIQELIANAEMIEGFPFQPLDHLIMCKLDSARDKDLEDVIKIKEYLG